MTYWESYVRASWELVVEAQGRSQIFLDTDIEAFLVFTMAKNIDKPTAIWQQPVATRMLEAKSLPLGQQRAVLQAVGEECLFIDAWQIKHNRWPGEDYFEKMGRIAFGMASTLLRPPDTVLEVASTQFNIISQVLRQVRDLQQKASPVQIAAEKPLKINVLKIQ